MKKLEMDSKDLNDIPKEEKIELERLTNSDINLRSIFTEFINDSYYIKRLWLELNDNELDSLSFECLEKLIIREGHLNLSHFYCPNLKELDLRFIKIADFSFLGHLKNLQKLSIDLCNLTQFPAVKSLHALHTLDLGHNKLTTLADLKLSDNFENLQKIFLVENQINDLCDFEPLNNLPNLRYLDLSRNKIIEIDVKKELPSLDTLELHNNQISAVKNLKNLPNLTKLGLSHNKLTQIDFKNFENVPSLTKIFIDDNNFDNVFTEEKPISSILNLEDGPKHIQIKGWRPYDNYHSYDYEIKSIDKYLRTIGWRYTVYDSRIERIPEPYAELDINEYIKLRLEDGEIQIFVKDDFFEICAMLLAEVPIESFEEINSVDDLIPLEQDLKDHASRISLETQFWAHASNLQAWAEYEYDTRLLHTNIAFPLLEKLTEAGDPLAKKRFKEEIAKRYSSRNPTVIKFLELGGYLKYLSNEEMASLKKPHSYKKY